MNPENPSRLSLLPLSSYLHFFKKKIRIDFKIPQLSHSIQYLMFIIINPYLYPNPQNMNPENPLSRFSLFFLSHFISSTAFCFCKTLLVSLPPFFTSFVSSSSTMEVCQEENAEIGINKRKRLDARAYRKWLEEKWLVSHAKKLKEKEKLQKSKEKNHETNCSKVKDSTSELQKVDSEVESQPGDGEDTSNVSQGFELASSSKVVLSCEAPLGEMIDHGPRGSKKSLEDLPGCKTKVPKVPMACADYPRAIALHGEQDEPARDSDLPPSTVWNSLLEGRNPLWKLLPGSPEKTRRCEPLARTAQRAECDNDDARIKKAPHSGNGYLCLKSRVGKVNEPASSTRAPIKAGYPDSHCNSTSSPSQILKIFMQKMGELIRNQKMEIREFCRTESEARTKLEEERKLEVELLSQRYGETPFKQEELKNLDLIYDKKFQKHNHLMDIKRKELDDEHLSSRKQLRDEHLSSTKQLREKWRDMGATVTVAGPQRIEEVQYRDTNIEYPIGPSNGEAEMRGTACTSTTVVGQQRIDELLEVAPSRLNVGSEVVQSQACTSTGNSLPLEQPMISANLPCSEIRETAGAFAVSNLQTIRVHASTQQGQTQVHVGNAGLSDQLVLQSQLQLPSVWEQTHANSATAFINQSTNSYLQSSSSLICNLLPFVGRDPVQNELLKLTLEKEKADKIHEDELTLLKSNHEKKIQEIQTEYDVSCSRVESAYLQSKRELESRYHKVYANKLLADSMQSFLALKSQDFPLGEFLDFSLLNFPVQGSAVGSATSPSAPVQVVNQLSEPITLPHTSSALHNTGNSVAGNYGSSSASDAMPRGPSPVFTYSCRPKLKQQPAQHQQQQPALHQQEWGVVMDRQPAQPIKVYHRRPKGDQARQQVEDSKRGILEARKRN